MMKFKRYPQEKNKSIGVWLFLIFLLVMGAVVVRYVYTAPYFKVKEVRVKGAGRLSETTILGWAGVPLEKCIFGVNLRRISRRIESRPRVKKAKISRSFPSTIVIEVEERQPFVYLLCDKVLWEVDEEGTVLGEVDILRDLAVITGISSHPLSSNLFPTTLINSLATQSKIMILAWATFKL